MSYSTNPVQDADRFQSAAYSYQEAAEQAERLLVDEFIKAARAGRMQAPALFAPSTTDWLAPPKADNTRYMRYQLVGEVLGDSLNYGMGPTLAEAMGLLCKVAYGGESQKEAAQALLGRMALAFAQQNALPDMELDT